MTKGCVTAQKGEKYGNPIGLANDNPLLDNQSHIINFDDVDHTKLTANMIAESLYFQCDPNGNQCILLGELVDHQCLDTTVKLSE
jgi:hypothetical protein